MEKPYVIENGQRVFNFKKTLYYIQHTGRKKYGPTFTLHREDVQTLRKLIIYMIYEEELCKKEGIDLNKGVLLIGPIGSGKTTIMTLMREFLFPEQDYFIKSATDIALEFHKEGTSVIQKEGNRHKILCFDDLGAESSKKFYGSEFNTMAEILLKRYKLQVNHAIITHVTTNLNADELCDLYGNRVRSRLRKMFNLISFPRETVDKRR